MTAILSNAEILSPRENQVLCFLSAGYTVTDIGDCLNLSVKTISTYRTRLRRKLGLKEPISNESIVVAATEAGLVEVTW